MTHFSGVFFGGNLDVFVLGRTLEQSAHVDLLRRDPRRHCGGMRAHPIIMWPRKARRRIPHANSHAPLVSSSFSSEESPKRSFTDAISFSSKNHRLKRRKENSCTTIGLAICCCVYRGHPCIPITSRGIDYLRTMSSQVLMRTIWCGFKRSALLFNEDNLCARALFFA